MEHKIPQAPRAWKIPGTNTANKADDYAWIRDPNWSAVLKNPDLLRSDIRAYLQAENDYCRLMLKPSEHIRKRLFAEMKARIREDDRSAEDRDGDYFYYTRWEAQQQYPLFCRRRQGKTSEESLLDGNREARGHTFWDIGECLHSPNHRMLAWTTDEQGSEFYTLYIRDLQSGRTMIKPIADVQGDVVWFNDSRAFVYVTLDKNHRPDRVCMQSLDGEQRTLYQEHDKSFFVTIDKTRSSRFIIIQAHDHTHSEVWLLDANDRQTCLLYTSPSPRDRQKSRMPSSA